jgi:hypothetical protein
MVNSRSKSGEEIREQSGMFLQVEVKSPVIDFEICSLDDDLFERVVFLRLVYRQQEVGTQASTECSIIASTALSNSS